MPSTSLKSKSTSAFVWDLSGSLGNQGVAFIISVVLARLLAPAEFGLIAMVNVIFIFSNLLLDVGLGSALIQRKRLLPIHFSSVFYFNVSIGLLLTILTYFSAPWIAQFYQQPLLKPLIEVMSVSFVINAATIIQNIKLRKALNLKHRSLITIVANIISGTTGIVMAYQGFGVWSLLAQQLLNKVIFSATLWITGGWLPQLAFSVKALKQLWSFGFNVFITDFLGVIFTKLDVVIIGKLFPIATLGFYQRGLSLKNIIIQFSTNSLVQVLFPVFSHIQNDLQRTQQIVFRAISLISVLIFFVVGLGYFCAEEFIIIVFTEKWLPAVRFFQLLLIANIAAPFATIFINVIIGRGNSKANLKLSLLKKIPQGLNLIIGFWFGIYGFMYGLILVTIIGFVMNTYFTKKELKVDFKWFFKPIIPCFIIALSLLISLEFGLSYFTISNNYILLLVKSTSFSLLYFGLLYILRIPSFTLFIKEIKDLKTKQK